MAASTMISHLQRASGMTDIPLCYLLSSMIISKDRTYEAQEYRWLGSQGKQSMPVLYASSLPQRIDGGCHQSAPVREDLPDQTTMPLTNEEAVDFFNETITGDADGKYSVSLLWKQSIHLLGVSRQTALRRHNSNQ